MTKLASVRAAALVIVPAVVAGVAQRGVSKTSSGLSSLASRLEGFADRFKARCLRWVAGAFEKHGAFLEKTAVVLGEKASDLRALSSDVFAESRALAFYASHLREEADDLDPPAPVLSDEPKADGEVTDPEV